MRAVDTFRMLTSHPMSKRHGSFGTLSRFARWQVASRIIKSPIALPFVDGSILLASKGQNGATGNYYYGLHEPEEMGFLLHALRADDLFLDVGANIGSFTVLAAKVIGAETVAVEPVPSTFAILERNIAINGARAKAVHAAVSDKPGTVRISTGLDSMNRVLKDGDALASADVPAITLDSLGVQPTIIKIDVEGHEAAVIAGGQETLRSAQAVIMETFGGGELLTAMEGLGFTPFGYDPFTRELHDYQGQANTIFVRDAEWARQRVKSARRFGVIDRGA